MKRKQNKTKKLVSQAWWLTTGILATYEAGIRWITWANSSQDPILKIPNTKKQGCNFSYSGRQRSGGSQFKASPGK
jgi:hypothetical protein